MRRPDPEPVPVLLEGRDEWSHELVDALPRLPCLADDPVIHVGQVHDVEDLEPAGLEPAAQQIFKQEGPEVSDVGVVPDGRPAGVQRDAGPGGAA